MLFLLLKFRTVSVIALTLSSSKPGCPAPSYSAKEDNIYMMLISREQKTLSGKQRIIP